MEDNNLNQNEGIVDNNDISYQDNPTTPNLETNSQYQSNEIHEYNLTETTNKQKNILPLVVFGSIIVFAIILVIALIFKNQEDNQEKATINGSARTLVVYFSHDGENYGKDLDPENKVYLTEGNTEVMAKIIANYIHADIYEIEPAIPYTTDLKELYDQARAELNNDVLPEIKNKVTNLDSYEVVFIGYPIWHKTFPQIIKTFVKENEEILKNKIIVPFNTHAGTGAEQSHDKLFNLIGTSNNKRFEGIYFNGTEVKKTETSISIKEWLERLGYIVY